MMAIKFFMIVLDLHAPEVRQQIFSLMFYTGLGPGDLRVHASFLFTFQFFRQLDVMLAASTFADPWRFEPNPEVYLLVAFLDRRVHLHGAQHRARAPCRRASPWSPAASRSASSAAMLVLFVASTWPMHQIGEGYLYSRAHGAALRCSATCCRRWCCWPRPSGCCARSSARAARTGWCASSPSRWWPACIFNLMVMVLHIPGVVNAVHHQRRRCTSPCTSLVVLTAVLMWMPVVGPLPELQMALRREDDLPVPA